MLCAFLIGKVTAENDPNDSTIEIESRASTTEECFVLQSRTGNDLHGKE